MSLYGDPRWMVPWRLPLAALLHGEQGTARAARRCSAANVPAPLEARDEPHESRGLSGRQPSRLLYSLFLLCFSGALTAGDPLATCQRSYAAEEPGSAPNAAHVLRLPVSGAWLVAERPGGGVVLEAHGASPDLAIRSPGAFLVEQVDSAGQRASLVLDLGGSLRLHLSGLAAESLAIKPGQWLVDDAIIGMAAAVAPDGPPILDVVLASRRRGRGTLPLAFERVRVTVAGTSEQSGARDVDRWVPEAGVVVERSRGGDVDSDEPILFYHQRREYGCFSNFSTHVVEIDGKRWRTSEHYYQAMKFPDDPARQQRILEARTPMAAKRVAWEQDARLRGDWDTFRVEVMRQVLSAKFRQHHDIREVLLSTADRSLVEHTRNDRFWADGGDGTGANRLGRLLMELRDELRKEPVR